MKKHFILVAIALFCMMGFSASAQDVSTTALLYDSPYRHYINPSFEPSANGYVYLPILGHTSLTAGNNSLTINDLIINQDGKTMWTLNPLSMVNPLDAFKANTLVRADANIGLIGFGFRIKENSYFHFNLNERIDAGVALPKSLFQFALGGGMSNLYGNNNFDISALGMQAQVYTEASFGYSRHQTDIWDWGLKVKLLLGTAYVGVRNNALDLDASIDRWSIRGDGSLYMAAPLQQFPALLNYDDFKNFGWADQIKSASIASLMKPAGVGAAFDLGFSVTPVEHLRLSASLTDIGFLYWHNSRRYDYTMNAMFDGAGQFKYSDFQNEEGKFDSQRLMDTISANMQRVLQNAIASQPGKKGFAAPITMKLNASVEGNFWDDRIGVGLFSTTMLYNSRIYEEVTVGAAIRPATWFNFAVSYSALNGRWSNIGAGIVLRGGPFSINLAADYVPLSWATTDPQKAANLPYKTPGVNAELGIAVVWGWKSRRDKDKDGVFDRFDLCPDTPRGVEVDEDGCPLDEDGDGVPDYMDECPGTPKEAYDLIDSVGCPLDTDGDKVPDYLDECPDTPAEAFGMVDEKGCPIDSDGDGVPDYMDECPDTPKAAQGLVNEHGCPIDSDEDGVPDYMDECPNTPEVARQEVDEKGCPKDSDHDGVPDYMDECPNTPLQAIGYVDAKGCELDTDGDGVPDYKDLCPEIAGPASNKGCPEMKREIKNLLKKALQGIQFETGKAVIKKTSYPLLNQIAQTFIDNDDFRVEVQGHTDNVGKPELNQTLSEKRAEAVRDYLVKAGVPADHLTAHGYGDTMPVADNKTSKGRAQNRRVEFVITYETVTIETYQQYNNEQ